MNASGDLDRATLDDTSSDDLVAVIGSTFAGAVTLWSRGAQSMFGWTSAEAVGRRVGELADWGLTQEDLAEFIFVGSSGAWIREHEVTTRDGIRLKLKTTASLVVGQDGQDEVIASLVPLDAGMDGSPAVVRDRPFRAITERGSDLVLICDRNMIVSYAGPSLQEMFGYQPRQVVGVPGWKFVHPDEAPRLRREWLAAISSPGEHREVELRLRDASGRWRWIEMRISNMVADLALSAMVLNLRDVTANREMADRLAISERLLQSVMDAALEGIWVLDASGATVFANARMADLLAVDQARLANGSVLEFFDPAAGELIRQRMNHRAAGVRELYEFSFIRLDGQRRWFRSSGVPLHDEAGGYVGSVGLVSDITDFKLIEHELEKRGGADGPHSSVREAKNRPPEDESYVAALVADYLRAAKPEHPTAAPSFEESVPGLDRLSRRELEVVRMLLLGDRVPVIARHLFVSQSTVRNHLSSVFRKLRVRSQQELIVLLRERNLGS
ncbi:MAG: PAS domain S-box protein [Actinomycetota bacterium]|nr:PAS domain S-box protein [Actinomycetota bacterium]